LIFSKVEKEALLAAYHGGEVKKSNLSLVFQFPNYKTALQRSEADAKLL